MVKYKKYIFIFVIIFIILLSILILLSSYYTSEKKLESFAKQEISKHLNISSSDIKITKINSLEGKGPLLKAWIAFYKTKTNNTWQPKEAPLGDHCIILYKNFILKSQFDKKYPRNIIY